MSHHGSGCSDKEGWGCLMYFQQKSAIRHRSDKALGLRVGNQAILTTACGAGEETAAPPVTAAPVCTNVSDRIQALALLFYCVGPRVSVAE